MNLPDKNSIHGEALVARYHQTGKPVDKDAAVHAFLPLVKYIVGRIPLLKNSNLGQDDLYQFGIIGLIEALERFDPAIGVKFKSFAYRRIHGEVIDALRKEGSLSRTQLKLLHTIETAQTKLRAELHREPTHDEICRLSGIPTQKYNQVLQFRNMSYVLSLDESFQSNDDEPLQRKDMIADPSQISPENEMENEGVRRELKNIIQQLPEKLRLILALYYYEELTLYDIGKVIGVSESRVSQLLSQTLKDIRAQISPVRLRHYAV